MIWFLAKAGIAITDPSKHLIPVISDFSFVSVLVQRCQSALAPQQAWEDDRYPRFLHWEAETVLELPNSHIIHEVKKPKSK